MAEKSVDDVFAEILKDSRAIAIEVVESSAKKAQTDFMLKAYDLLAKYYDNFGTPKKYKRTYQLRKSITPVLEGKTVKGADEITIRVGVEYNSAQLEGLYHSNSPWHQSGDEWISRNNSNFNWNKDSDGNPIGNNGVPQPEWILGNFLKGVHIWGSEPDQQKKDTESTNRLMNKFIRQDIEAVLNQYIQSSLMEALSKRL